MTIIENASQLFELVVDGQSRIEEIHHADRIMQLDARFERKGVWAGVSELVEEAYLDLLKSGRHDILDPHNYELYRVLPDYRSAIGLKYGCLTDTAIGEEKTRNFPLDRAYRIVHGLVGLIAEWRSLYGHQRPWVLIVRHFNQAQYLATRFFVELARRLTHRHRLLVFVEASSDYAGSVHATSSSELRPAKTLAATIRLQKTTDHRISDQERIRIERNATPTMECWERIYVPLLAYYRHKGDALSAAKVALRAICLYNHHGYYYESSSFVDAVIPYFNQVVGDDEDARWNYTGNIFQGLVTTGREREALQFVEGFAKPYLSKPVLLAKMHYLLAMVYVRYLKPHDIGAAERHILHAIDNLETAKLLIPREEYTFLRVFLGNGLAFVRVRQERMREALDLCESGFKLLTTELGDEKHRLHRSVLLYNAAQVYLLLGRRDEALSAYRESIAMDPYYSEYYNEAANIFQALEDYQTALEFYDQAIKYSAPYPEVYFNKAVCLSRQERWSEALECFAYSEALNPEQPELYLMHAEILEELGHESEALKDYCTAIKLAPDSITARVNRAVLHYSRGEFAQALSDMDYVIRINPDEPSHYENRAAIYEAMDRLDLSRRDHQSAASCRLGA
jgi:tetratricopeptide (TPR) repeat protein